MHNVLPQNDFLELPADKRYQCVVMNPPFENGQPIDHIRYAYEMLDELGGRLVSVAPSAVLYNSQKKFQDFREWLSLIGGHTEILPADSFKDAFRSTGVSCVLVIIDK